MDSLRWVDQTYLQKHASQDPHDLRALYYPHLKSYPKHGDSTSPKKPKDALVAFLIRYARKASISLAVYLLSYLPVVGRFVLPAASFYTFNKAVGLKPALVIFGSSVVLPRRYLVVFLQSYFASRSLVRDLVCICIRLANTAAQLITHTSLSRTSAAFLLRKSRGGNGSEIAKASCSDSASASSFC